MKAITVQLGPEDARHICAALEEHIAELSAAAALRQPSLWNVVEGLREALARLQAQLTPANPRLRSPRRARA